MPTSIAIASGASAQAAAASARAARAECLAAMPHHNPKTATVQEMRYYADCVYRVHGSGEPMSPESVLGLKFAVFLLLAGFAVGAWKGWEDEGALGAFMWGVAGAAMVFAALLVFALLVAGVAVLFG